MSSPHIPPGHHYSTTPSQADIDRALDRAAAADPTAARLGTVDLRTAEQWDLLTQLARHASAVPHHGRIRRFTYDNTWFTNADALLYALMLLEHRPERVVEVGSGFSSALGLDVDDLLLHGTTRFTFIEPDAERLRELLSPTDLRGRLLETPVQDVPWEVFESLRANDILMVDGSHILKAGSDVQYLVDEVFPRLPSGVLIHVHDVFWPFEYPRSWLEHGFHPTEAYALRLLLQEPSILRIELFIDQLRRGEPDWFAEHLPVVLDQPFPTGGIWLSRT
jgi:hypothetical protein